jgi:VIT1/CCC1 family predicted Fe2+/Mn2+ transporter
MFIQILSKEIQNQHCVVQHLFECPLHLIPKMMAASETSPLLQDEGVTRPSQITTCSTIQPSISSSSLSIASTATGDPPSFDTNDVLRDVIIGFSDGLTVPFALTAGLSSLGNARLVIMGGLAELFSGMISMGLGAYLAAVTERDQYLTREKEKRRALELEASGDEAADQCCRNDIFDVLETYGVPHTVAKPVVEALCRDQEQGLRFVMEVSLRLDKPSVHRAWISAVTMGLSYFIGGLVPMIPYFVMSRVREALYVSIGVTVLVLLGFGYAKDFVAIRTHRAGLWGAVQTLIIGLLAAGTSYVIVKTLDGEGG